ncbi:MAG: hypothetical protein ACRCX2_36920 [Paraclostridium sp.]
MSDTRKTFEEMSYKEFVSYCNNRACDGRWGKNEAMNCIMIFESINSIKVKTLCFTWRKKTEQAREDAWRKIKSAMIESVRGKNE